MAATTWPQWSLTSGVRKSILADAKAAEAKRPQWSLTSGVRKSGHQIDDRLLYLIAAMEPDFRSQEKLATTPNSDEMDTCRNGA